MATQRLLFPEHVRDLLARRYAGRYREWLAGGGTWPMRVGLGMPAEKDAREHPDLVRKWAGAWQAWQGPGTLEWHERQWSALGVQRLPKSLSLAHAGEIADWVGETERWRCAVSRHRRFIARWPELETILPRHFDMLANYGDSEIERLMRLLAWLEANPKSGLYPRQVPVPGLDSKWIETRKALLLNLLSGLRSEVTESLVTCNPLGLRRLPALMRMRVLDPKLRACLGGMGDVSAPVEDLASLHLDIRCAYIVENLQTGLAFDDLPGTVAIMGLGYGVEALGRIPWLAAKPCRYWGDLDTHGFAILSHTRSFLPQITSCLMNEGTLLQHKAFWGEETQQHPATELPGLTNEERDIYRGLKEHRWGHNVRLEQERIDWSWAWEKISLWAQETL